MEPVTKASQKVLSVIVDTKSDCVEKGLKTKSWGPHSLVIKQWMKENVGSAVSAMTSPTTSGTLREEACQNTKVWGSGDTQRFGVQRGRSVGYPRTDTKPTTAACTCNPGTEYQRERSLELAGQQAKMESFRLSEGVY